MEQESRKRRRKNEIKKVILASIQVTGVLGVAMVAPNALQGLEKMGLIPAKRQKEIINRSRDRMIKQGLLRRKGKFLELTEKGESALRQLSLRDFAMKRPKRWDGKWRVIIFDIPIARKNLRVKIRATLQAIGFVRLQDSVWIYPYDCEDLITLLKADFKVGKDVLYMIVDSLENDTSLRREFGVGSNGS